MTETDLSNKIKESLMRQTLWGPRAIYKIQYDYMRLESHLTLQGLPDANLCVQPGIKERNGYSQNGTEIWLEYKVGNNNPSPLQIAWARRRFDLGQTNVYCVRGYSEATNLVSFMAMDGFWETKRRYEHLTNCTYDELAYRLLTGEFYDKGRST